MQMEIVRRWRAANGHSQARLGHAIGVHPTMIAKIENGDNSMGLENFYRLIRYTGIDAMEALEDIFERTRPVRRKRGK